MIPVTFALPAFILGILFLYKGSDILVEGTSKTAAQFGVSSLIISVIVVAFGTSSPEFAISVGAAVQNQPAISIGNIIGSCIANLLLVLGISAIIRPIKIQKKIIKREMPIMMTATLLLFIFSYLNLLDSFHFIGGFIFLIFFIYFIIYFIRCANKERLNHKQYKKGRTQKNILFIILGIIGVVVGAELLIESAVTIASFFGISKMIIALSMVAIGTSIPELVVSIMAVIKKESDIAVGNVLGSNIFNIFFILGISALIIPLGASESLEHLVWLLIVTIIMFPILYSKHEISRKEGILLLAIYTIFIWFIFFGYILF